jgi:hypothetical protein
MFSFNSWFISITIVLLAILVPDLHVLAYQHAYKAGNPLVFQPHITQWHPHVIPAPWSHELSYSYEPAESIDDKSSTKTLDGPRNGSLWLFEGFPTDISNCDRSGGLSPPKKFDLQPDVCLYGKLNNRTLLVKEMAVCEDGKEAWLAMYRDPTCHENPQMISPNGIIPGTFCITAPSALSEIHIIFQMSLIFHCVDAVERSMPKKLINSDLDVPVIEDPPKKPGCCE